MALYSDFVYRHSISVGQALEAAKREYCSTEQEFDGYDEKVVLEATLYGLPMYEFSTGGGLADSESARDPGILSAQSLTVLSPGFTVRSLTYAFPDFEEVVNDQGTFFRLGGQTEFDDGSPIQPRASADVSLVKTTAHGTVLRQATYLAIPGFDPTIGRAVSESSLSDEPDFDAPGWFPTVPYAISRLEDKEKLNIVLGQFHPDQATERLYSELGFDIYYHDSSTDWTLPGILEVSSALQDGQATVSVEATDDSGIHTVVVAYTGGGGSWQSLELVAGGGPWTGSFAAGAETEFFVQVVDGAGNVAVADNSGRYYRPGQNQHSLFLPLVLRQGQ